MVGSLAHAFVYFNISAGLLQSAPPPCLGLGIFDSTVSSFVSSWYYCLIVGVSNFCAFCLFLAFLFCQLLLIEFSASLLLMSAISFPAACF